jgi:hypothetical protein
MNEKYVLIKPYECQYGTLPSGSEIIYFRGQFYLNGGPIPQVWNGMFKKIIEDDNYVRKYRINKNEF